MTFDFSSKRYRQGMKAETAFYDLMTDHGYLVTYSSRHEDIFQHIDFKAVLGDKNMKIDVKSLKKVNGIFTNKWVWIETKGQYGDGWLWSKYPTHYAFQMSEKEFLVIKKEDLQGIVKEHYPNATIPTTSVEQVIGNTKLYAYTRPRFGNLPELKNERVILVKTDYIREKAVLISKKR